MSAVLFYLLLPLLYFISYLPFRVLYVISDGLYFLIYRVFGYRKKVVMENIRNSFPEKSEAEVKKICKDFYHYFCDLILETVKTLTVTEKELRKHVKFEDTSIFHHYYEKKQSLIIVMGHQGNWELIGERYAIERLHRLMTIYHPLSNPHFEKLLRHMRTRYGNGLYTMKETLRGMVRDKNELTVTAFVADQTPSPEGAYWMEFLNQDTPVFMGTEKISQKFKYPVLYLSIKRPKRGLYTMHIEVLTEHPENTHEGEISYMHTKRLERDIIESPEIWLWTHRRWKHKRKN